MQVEKFTGDNITDATIKVKKTLGPNALILSTKKLEKNNYNGKTIYEIWAVPNEVNGETTKEETVKNDLVNGIKNQVEKIKKLLVLMSRNKKLEETIINNRLAYEIYTILIKKGIRKKYVHEIIKGIGFIENNSTTKNVHKEILLELMKKIRVHDPFNENNEKKIIAFLGTTGVGKTTTIAKIAAELSLKNQKKVGLISIDNYRIGALEQIKCYAKILGIPCFQAFDKKDMEFSLKRLTEKEIILIDTAGRSHYDRNKMVELKKLLYGEFKIENHLLLSANMDAYEMINVTKNFSNMDIKSYIFTKTDETKNHGKIINHLMRSQIPASYITNGQRVPEDLVKATKTNIMRMLF